MRRAEGPVVLGLVAEWLGLVADEPLGLVKEQPASGRYVKTEKGYMVPYKGSIPGTKVTFEPNIPVFIAGESGTGFGCNSKGALKLIQRVSIVAGGSKQLSDLDVRGRVVYPQHFQDLD